MIHTNDTFAKKIKKFFQKFFKTSKCCSVLNAINIKDSTIDGILNSLYIKNPREEEHSRRVSEICIKIGIEMGFGKTDLNKLKTIGLMHDIGKIAIDENILNKTSKLTNTEWIEMKRHSELGYLILASNPELSEIAEIVLKHHERLDGLGYPKGLKKQEISLMARILSVADSYDAMTSKRTYKEALSQEMAIQELRQHSHTQFDAEVVEIFINRVLKKLDTEQEFDKVSRLIDVKNNKQIMVMPETNLLTKYYKKAENYIYCQSKNDFNGVFMDKH